MLFRSISDTTQNAIIFDFQNDLGQKVIYALDNNNNSCGSLGVGLRFCGSAGRESDSHTACCSSDRACRAADKRSRGLSIDLTDRYLEFFESVRAEGTIFRARFII